MLSSQHDTYLAPESGLPSPYETKPFCPDGELDLDLLQDTEVLVSYRFGGVASGDLEREEPLLLELEFDLPLSGNRSSLLGPSRAFNLSLMGGRLSSGLGLRLGLRLRSRSLKRPRTGLREMLLLRLLLLWYLGRLLPPRGLRKRRGGERSE